MRAVPSTSTVTPWRCSCQRAARYVLHSRQSAMHRAALGLADEPAVAQHRHDAPPFGLGAAVAAQLGRRASKVASSAGGVGSSSGDEAPLARVAAQHLERRRLLAAAAVPVTRHGPARFLVERACQPGNSRFTLGQNAPFFAKIRAFPARLRRKCARRARPSPRSSFRFFPSRCELDRSTRAARIAGAAVDRNPAMRRRHINDVLSWVRARLGPGRASTVSRRTSTGPPARPLPAADRNHVS